MKYYVYILTNKWNSVLYIGVTNNLAQRIWSHKEKFVEGFTNKYNVTKLVYVEEYSLIKDAIAREKQLKKYRREKKIKLIESMNPQWKELKI